MASKDQAGGGKLEPLSGWLDKRGQWNKAWKSRYCQLEPKSMSLTYSDGANKPAKGCIIVDELTQLQALDARDKDANTLSFAVVTGSRTFRFRAMNSMQAKTWKETILSYILHAYDSKQQLLKEKMAKDAEEAKKKDAQAAAKEEKRVHQSHKKAQSEAQAPMPVPDPTRTNDDEVAVRSRQQRSRTQASINKGLPKAATQRRSKSKPQRKGTGSRILTSLKKSLSRVGSRKNSMAVSDKGEEEPEEEVSVTSHFAFESTHGYFLEDDETGLGLPEIAGYLEKRGKWNKAWRKRWCYLESCSSALYYATDPSSAPKGHITINSKTIITTLLSMDDPDKDNPVFLVQVPKGGKLDREWRFRAANPEAVTMWTTVLRRYVDYAKNGPPEQPLPPLMPDTGYFEIDQKDSRPREATLSNLENISEDTEGEGPRASPVPEEGEEEHADSVNPEPEDEAVPAGRAVPSEQNATTPSPAAADVNDSAISTVEDSKGTDNAAPQPRGVQIAEPPSVERAHSLEAPTVIIDKSLERVSRHRAATINPAARDRNRLARGMRLRPHKLRNRSLMSMKPMEAVKLGRARHLSSTGGSSHFYRKRTVTSRHETKFSDVPVIDEGTENLRGTRLSTTKEEEKPEPAQAQPDPKPKAQTSDPISAPEPTEATNTVSPEPETPSTEAAPAETAPTETAPTETARHAEMPSPKKERSKRSSKAKRVSKPQEPEPEELKPAVKPKPATRIVPQSALPGNKSALDASKFGVFGAQLKQRRALRQRQTSILEASLPSGIVIRDAPGMGKGVFATRPIASGEVLFTEKKMFGVENADNDIPVCGNCMRFVGNPEMILQVLGDLPEPPADLPDKPKHVCCPVVECSNQCGVLYCSKRCRIEAWHNFHELLCTADSVNGKALRKFYQHVKDSENERFDLASRVYAYILKRMERKRMSVEEALEPFSHYNKEPWWETVPPPEDCEVQEAGAFTEVLINMTKTSLYLLRKALMKNHTQRGLFNLQTYSSILGIFERNNWPTQVRNPLLEYKEVVATKPEVEQKALKEKIGDKLWETIDKCSEWRVEGTGLYALGHYINHSCRPNIELAKAEYGMDDSTVVVASTDISPGEQLFISYIDPSQPFVQRRKTLSFYGFECKCPKCLKDMMVYRFTKPQVVLYSSSVPGSMKVRDDIRRLKLLFSAFKIEYTEVDCSLDENEYEKRYMLKVSGLMSLPQVFVNGDYRGGAAEFIAANEMEAGFERFLYHGPLRKLAFYNPKFFAVYRQSIASRQEAGGVLEDSESDDEEGYTDDDEEPWNDDSLLQQRSRILSTYSQNV